VSGTREAMSTTFLSASACGSDGFGIMTENLDSSAGTGAG
jgi:hypothetical protein